MDIAHHTEMKRALRGTRIAITGGTSGLGLALVRECVARGATACFYP